MKGIVTREISIKSAHQNIVNTPRPRLINPLITFCCSVNHDSAHKPKNTILTKNRTIAMIKTIQYHLANHLPNSLRLLGLCSSSNACFTFNHITLYPSV